MVAGRSRCFPPASPAPSLLGVAGGGRSLLVTREEERGADGSLAVVGVVVVVSGNAQGAHHRPSHALLPGLLTIHYYDADTVAS